MLMLMMRHTVVIFIRFLLSSLTGTFHEGVCPGELHTGTAAPLRVSPPEAVADLLACSVSPPRDARCVLACIGCPPPRSPPPDSSQLTLYPVRLDVT